MPLGVADAIVISDFFHVLPSSFKVPQREKLYGIGTHTEPTQNRTVIESKPYDIPFGAFGFPAPPRLQP